MGLHRATATSLVSRLFAPGSPQALAFLRAAWPHAAGEELARRTEVLAVENGTLRLRVPDARWQKVLHRMQRDILSRLHAVAGDLTPRRLGFTLGSVIGAASAATSSSRVPRPVAAPGPIPGPAPEALVAAAEGIPDPEIRQRFLASANLYLSRAGDRAIATPPERSRHA
ncbi:MAG: DUF721 domain-containing protein [Acidobacteria bacterium]|nr:DUF721 domain-containing protein [Acidobacteriota bacterium]